MKKHAILMILGCTLPILLIFILPFFGVSGYVSIFIFLVLMFGCHFLMLGSHGSHNEDNTANQSKKEDSHASHQH